MVKRPRISKDLKRNPEAPHVKRWIAFRKRKERPKATLSSTRGMPLTFARYKALMKYYEGSARKSLEGPRRDVIMDHAIIKEALKDSTVSRKMKDELFKIAVSTMPIRSTTISNTRAGFEIAKEITNDFGKTKGLEVFGFGVGYAQLLFFLKNFAGAKVKGIDLTHLSKEQTKSKRLGITHGKSVADPSIRKFGKFDVTYSIYVFETDIMNQDTAFEMFRNIAALTRKGGKSYHLIMLKNRVPFPKAEIEAMGEALGLRIDRWDTKSSAGLFIKLTKVKD